mmetsp:Transcript_16530/g.37959  ORF Transcript_16530/g.37959 Transcript_16530/m.37959 type:complete len:104 (+) Transcript_16530:421-732(+)
MVPMQRTENSGRIFVVITKQAAQLFSTNPSPKIGICCTAKIVERNNTSAQLHAKAISAKVKMILIHRLDKRGSAYNTTNRTLHQRGIATPKKNHMACMKRVPR